MVRKKKTVGDYLYTKPDFFEQWGLGQTGLGIDPYFLQRLGFTPGSGWGTQRGRGQTGGWITSQPPSYRRGGLQYGYGLGGIFRDAARTITPALQPVLKEVAGVGQEVGINLVQNLVKDLIEGKSSKESAKARGKQAQLEAGNVAIRRTVELLTKPAAKPEPESEPDLSDWTLIETPPDKER